MKLGVVILNYKTYKDVFNCIDSIRQTIGEIPYKIYVVDNKSPNESLQKLNEKYSLDKDVVVIANDKNGGFSAGNNVGFKYAISDGCDFILCTNSDVKFYENAISIMVDCISSEEDLAVVGPKVYMQDGEVQSCNRGILTPMTFLLRRKGFSIFDWFGLGKKYTYQDYKYDKRLYPQGMVSGCCFLIKSSVLPEINYLDEKMFLYHEEDVLGAKLRKINKKVCLEPKAEILHYGGKSTGGVSPFIRYCTFYSGMYYLCAYGQSSRFSTRFAMFMIKRIMGVYSLFNKEYREYNKKLKKDFKEFRKILKNR